MRRQIRYGVHETNSSSTHAICISKTQNVNDIKLPKDITFDHDEFGWEFSILRHPYEKAAYLNEAIASCYCYDGIEKLIEKKKQLHDMLEEVGVIANFENDKCDISYWILNSNMYKGENPKAYYDGGYIDHGGETREFVDAVLDDKDLLIKYLFGDSFVVTGNDNGDGFSDYMYKDDSSYWYDGEDAYKDEFKDYQIFEKSN